MSEDILQLSLLEESCNLSSIKYKQMIAVFAEFLGGFVDNLNSEGKVDSDFLKYFSQKIEVVNRFIAGGESSDLLLGDRIEIWRRYDLEENYLKKGLLRALVCCFYEEEGGDDEILDSLELFFSLLRDVDEGGCLRFRIFFELQIKKVETK
ncbi:hypothetical protein QZM22_13360 [Burkholderia oklahomensis]|uniref:hypothetical protein n=1 Tax=Burkholderia oklahomensis TaxID=342113 RepID=UPI00264D9DE9|nr:hypothetical protein [Burkholderia oklahomensis]MDN7673480.1 hypothetical protein [Burkholderia oklahomensis]